MESRTFNLTDTVECGCEGTVQEVLCRCDTAMGVRVVMRESSRCQVLVTDEAVS